MITIPSLWQPSDSFVDFTGREILVFEGSEESGEWRVECRDDDGSCFAAIFAGRDAEARARAYYEAIKAGTITL